MHRIDSAGSESGAFVDRDAVLGKPGTKVDAAIMNALQEELAGFIESAGVTLAKGTNTQLAAALAAWLQGVAHTFTKAQVFKGETGDTNPAIVLSGTATNRKLHLKLNGDASHTRIYVTPGGLFEIVVNAGWDGSQWVRDDTGVATRLVIATSGLMALYTYPAASASPFADSEWVLAMKLPRDGKITFTDVTTGATGSNPPAGTALANTLVAKNLCKAWASISHTKYNGTPPVVEESLTLDDAINVSGVAIADSDQVVRVTFASPMADTNYSVCMTSRPGPVTDDLATSIPRIKAKTVNYVDLGFGGWSNLLTTGWGLDVHVFGKQTS